MVDVDECSEIAAKFEVHNHFLSFKKASFVSVEWLCEQADNVCTHGLGNEKRQSCIFLHRSTGVFVFFVDHRKSVT